MKWHFTPQNPGHVETEVTQRDQFDNDEVNISETIVREAVQNSLDAGMDVQGPTRVKFRFVEDGIDPDFFRSLFEHQLEHAKVAGLDIGALDFNSPRALVIEDFGTLGLTGAVNAWDDNNFCDFWRRHGKSHKSGKNRGRWGLGKLVYSATSRAGVFFGLTRRQEDPEVHLMGQTVLNLRTVGGDRYPPHGFFSDEEGQLPVPVRDHALVQQFYNNFGIDRSQEPGLSVVIPFPDPNFNRDTMVSIAIANYFYPLITKQLILQFDDLQVCHENIRQLARDYPPPGLDQVEMLFDFLEAVSATQEDALFDVKPTWAQDKKLDEDDFDEATLETIRSRFKEGELVGLRLPVTIKKKDGTDVQSSFAAYIQRPDNLDKGRDLYVRGGLTVPGEAKFGHRRAFGAMIAEEEDICSMLGDAENAAHTLWTTNTEKLRRNYRNTQPVLTVIKKSLVQLYDLLAEVMEERDEDLLRQFFWFDEPESSGKKRRPKPKPVDILEIKPKKPRLFEVHTIEGGFSITNTEGFDESKLPREVSVEVAYDVARGNPFRKYSEHDFKVGKNGSISVTYSAGITATAAAQNRWTFRVDKLPLKISATGFDANRDLKIKVN